MRHAACTFLALISLAASAAAQDGGRIPWKGKTDDPKFAMAEAKRDNRPMMLFFTSVKDPLCQKLSAGAFCDAAAIEAAERFVCIFVECEWGKKNTEITKMYNVKTYPAVMFLDPDGKLVHQLNNGEPAEVAKQMQSVASWIGRKKEEPAQVITLKALPVPDALMWGGRHKKRVLLFFRDESPATLTVGAALTDPAMKEILEGFVLGSDVFTKGAGHSAKYDVSRAPTLIVLDPTLPKPEEKPLAKIEGSRSARELIRELEGLSIRVPSDPASPPPDARPAPKEPEEKLSDDEIERRFIAARVAVAQDMIKRGKKDKAIEVYEDIIKSYPKHIDTVAVKKLLAEARK